MRSTLALPIMLSLCWCSVVACGDDGDDKSADAGAETPEQMPREVACIEESFGALTLFSEEPNTDEVVNDPQDDGWLTNLDTEAGGMSPKLPYLYLKFTDEGLKPVAINDDEAFESLDWDIAARRFVIRLNSGVSGPGLVQAARTTPRPEFAAVTEVPAGLDFRSEEYFTEDCTFVNDSTGIGPGVALASFWSYQSCVAMTRNVYIIEITLPKKRHVKFEVIRYYPKDRQDVCNETGAVPTPTYAGDMQVRWAFLD
jgi:hypothetical protein